MANTRHTTTTRRASIARFRHEIARGHLDVFLVRADDPLTTPLLSNARAHWFAQIETRKVCIFCKRSFTADDVQPGLFLLASYRCSSM